MSARRIAALAVLALGFAAPAGGAETRFGRVLLPGGQDLRVELAVTPEERARGYMFRDRVGPEDGMLFLFTEEDIHPFWMKNVRIPLDMIWIAADFTVVHVERDVPPCREDPCGNVSPLARALYVLELAGGRAEQLGLRPGAAVEILLPPPPRDSD